MHELQKTHSIDAFVSHDLQNIYIDNAVMESRSPNRYRFSLAHELAHIVLHKHVFENICFRSLREWKQVIQSMKETDRRWLEWQAHSFAGLLLVPRKPLREKLGEAVNMATDAGLDVHKYPDVAKDYVCNWIGKDFEVSAQVVEKRLDKDCFWPPS
jgi:Zn-dependent peptidase ImmA (M78 family)